MLYEFFINKKTQKTQMFVVRSQWHLNTEFLHKFNLKNSLQVFLRYDTRRLVTKT